MGEKFASGGKFEMWAGVLRVNGNLRVEGKFESGKGNLKSVWEVLNWQ